jgi:signal transduction histidine kinase
VQVIIDDNGAGVQSREQGFSSRGLGVIGMRERAQSLSGSMAVEARPGGGTRVLVTIPLAPHSRELRDSVVGSLSA